MVSEIDELTAGSTGDLGKECLKRLVFFQEFPINSQVYPPERVSRV